MFKVSFKKVVNGKEPIKVETFNKTITKVTLVGTLQLPRYLQNPIREFVDYYEGVDVSGAYSKELIITSVGIAKKSENDKWNETVGYRIAESKAKIKIYKFMFNLIKKCIRDEQMYITGISNITHLGKSPVDCLMNSAFKYKHLLASEEKHLNTLIHGTDTEGTQKP